MSSLRAFSKQSHLLASVSADMCRPRRLAYKSGRSELLDRIAELARATAGIEAVREVAMTIESWAPRSIIAEAVEEQLAHLISLLRECTYVGLDGRVYLRDAYRMALAEVAAVAEQAAASPPLLAQLAQLMAVVRSGSVESLEVLRYLLSSIRARVALA